MKSVFSDLLNCAFRVARPLLYLGLWLQVILGVGFFIGCASLTDPGEFVLNKSFFKVLFFSIMLPAVLGMLLGFCVALSIEYSDMQKLRKKQLLDKIDEELGPDFLEKQRNNNGYTPKGD